MDFILRSATILVLLFLSLVLIFKTYDGNDYVLLAAKPLAETITEAEQLFASGKNLDNFLLARRLIKNSKAQEQSMNELITVLVNGKPYETSILYAANNFLVYGTSSTSHLNHWQRYQLLARFVKAKQSLPLSVNDWQSVLAKK